MRKTYVKPDLLRLGLLRSLTLSQVSCPPKDDHEDNGLHLGFEIGNGHFK